jgi:hypothetical protein
MLLCKFSNTCSVFKAIIFVNVYVAQISIWEAFNIKIPVIQDHWNRKTKTKFISTILSLKFYINITKFQKFDVISKLAWPGEMNREFHRTYLNS